MGFQPKISKYSPQTVPISVEFSSRVHPDRRIGEIDLLIIFRSTPSYLSHAPFIHLLSIFSRFFQFADEPLTSSNRNSFNFTNHQQQAPSSSSSKRPALKLYLDAYDETTGVFWFVIYPTNTEIVALIQKMDRNMYKYNSGIKIWMLNFAVYDSFLNEIQASKTNYIVEEIPKFVVRGLNTFMSKSDILLSDPKLNLSAKMTQTLLPFQSPETTPPK